MLLRPSAYKIRSSPAHSRKRPSACISYAILSSAAVELWLFGCKKEGNFLALDFRSKIPYMFLQLHLILMPVNTRRDTQMDAGCCSSSTHPEENCNRSKCCLQIPFFCMPLLYTPPTDTHRAMFHGWMDSPPFFITNYKSATRGCKHLEMCRAIYQLLGIITHH